MEHSRLRTFCQLTAIPFATALLIACGGGKSGGTFEGSPENGTSPTDPGTPDLTPRLTLQIGTPTTNPSVIPPSATTTDIQFLSLVSGNIYPEELILDEVDSQGNVVSLNITQLKDDGNNADSNRGDRIFTGSLAISSLEAAEKFYRVRANNGDSSLQSSVSRFWISNCPSSPRPSDPQKTIVDPNDNDIVYFVEEIQITLTDNIAPDLSAIDELLSDINGTVVGCIPSLNRYLVEVPDNTSFEDINADIATLLAKAEIAEAYPNTQVISLQAGNGSECDTRECHRWYLDRIRAEEAWEIAGAGDEQMSVAVIDKGVDCDHQEIKCSEHNFDEGETSNHGTGVAGLIGAQNDNDTDLSGVAWKTELIPYYYDSQFDLAGTIAESIKEPSVKVINISSGTRKDSGNLIRNAICNAISSGRLVVAAAGNARIDDNCETDIFYPANYNAEIYDSEEFCGEGNPTLASGLITVGATDFDNNLAHWKTGTTCSNSLNVDIYAPGKNIYTTTRNNGYSLRDGTSFAAPLVSGSAAVIWASDPELSVVEVHDRLINSASILSQNSTDLRYRTSDERLEQKRLLNLFKAVGGKDSTVITDINPDDFNLTEKVGVRPDTLINSDPVTIFGINSSVPIDVVGGFYSIDGRPFTNAAGSINLNQSIVVQVRSSVTNNSASQATLTVGNLIRNFLVRTELAPQITPPAENTDNGSLQLFTFARQISVPFNTPIISNPVTIRGLTESIEIRITGGEYSIDDGDFRSGTATISNDQVVRLRVTSANTPLTGSFATLTTGNYSATFQINTTGSTVDNQISLVWVDAAEPSDKRIVTQKNKAVTDAHPVDIDGDGDIDILSSSGLENTVKWFENRGQGIPSFIEREISNRDASSTIGRDVFLSSVNSVDLNGDGNLDILPSSALDDVLIWFESDGSTIPSFTERTIITLPTSTMLSPRSAYTAASADIDNDGDNDILVAYKSGNLIAWYENDGNVAPTFTERVITNNINSPRQISSGDIDGDGDLDILFTAPDYDIIGWFENDGTSTPGFTQHLITELVGENQNALSYPIDVSLGDIDGDGDLDILSNSVFQQTISWYENDGGNTPNFTQNVVSNGATTAYSLGSSDVDGDGDIDLLSIDRINNTVLWYENDGASDPRFVTHLVTSSANSPESVAASDIDGDGDLEIVAASQSDNTVAWFTTIQRSVWLTEGSSWVHTEAAFDAQGSSLTYNISHGADSELFSINSSTGQITFANAPLTSAPEDANSDNVYEVWISVTNGSSTINRSIAVTVYTDDSDDDNDGTPDISDAFPLDPYEQFDNDLDGIGNNADNDDDNDGVPDSEDDSPLGGTNASTPLWAEAVSAKPSNTHIISRLIDRAADVHPADVNGDGHIDVLAVSALNNTLAWYQNDGNAVPRFTERLIVSDRSGASSVTTADLDNDGDLDVLLVAHFTILWYENNGATIPSFTEHLVKNDALGEIRLTLVDIDKDGDLDIFSSWMSGDTLAWYESDGAGTPNFTEHIITTTVDGPRSIAHGDMDGDGDIDILAASFFDNTLAWYENDGSAVPNFTIQVITTSASEASSVVAADIDGDNDLDIVLGSRDDDTVAWYENDGASNPSFTQRIITSSADGVVSVYVDDVDGDGDLDVLSAQFYGAYIAWYENSGTEAPTFIEHTITDKVTSPDKLNEMTPRGAASIATVDINGDGRKEVLTSSYFGDFIAWYNLNMRDEWVAEGESWTGTEVATDADNNALSYSIILGPDSDLFSIDAVNGTLRFENAPLLSSPQDSNEDSVYKVWVSASDGVSQINQSVSLHVYADDSDDDDDGVPDLSDAFPLNPEEQLDTDVDEIGNNEDKDDDDDGIDDSKDNAPLDNSHTSAPQWVNGSDLPIRNIVTTATITVNTIHASDIDGDGDIDLVSTSEDSDTVTWYENDGSRDANFTPRIITNNSAGVRSVTTADINGDGHMDVLSASPVDNTIGWYINDGDTIPGFTSQPITTSAAGAYVVDVADIDGDGDIDVLSASQNDENVVWYENDGAVVPSFTTRSISRNKVISPITVSTADVNGDNALDVLVAVRGDNSIYWYENNGATPPNFTERLISNLGGTTVSITAADMDNDGDTDILTAGENWTIRWYENPGFDAPFFMQHTITDSAQSASAISVADVDNDGDMDVLASSSQDNTVAWYENDGNSIPQFIEHLVTTSAIGASSVTTADITGDGRLEIISAFTLSDSGGVAETVAWYSVNQRSATVIQGNTLVIAENASDSDANLLTYAISHGADALHFSINSETGDVTFANAPLVTSPEDSNGDNVYEVSIRVTDGFSTLVRSIEVTVTEN